MNLIDEQDRLLTRCAEPICARRKHAAHFSDVTFNAADPNKFCVRHLCDDLRQRGFAGAGRPVQNHRWQTISFDRPAQEFARPENVFLADEFPERPRSHPCGKRRSGVRGFKLLRFFE